MSIYDLTDPTHLTVKHLTPEDYARFEAEEKLITEEFGESDFVVSINSKKWNDFVCNGPKNVYFGCGPYTHQPFNKVLNQQTITIKQVIHFLIDNKFTAKGYDHKFLEVVSFNKKKNRVELWFGS